MAIKCQTSDGGRVLDVRWETCGRVAELIVRNHKRRRQQNSGDVQVQLKVVTPITAANMAFDVHAMAPMDPNKVHQHNKLIAHTVSIWIWGEKSQISEMWSRGQNRILKVS